MLGRYISFAQEHSSFYQGMCKLRGHLLDEEHSNFHFLPLLFQLSFLMQFFISNQAGVALGLKSLIIPQEEIEVELYSIIQAEVDSIFVVKVWAGAKVMIQASGWSEVEMVTNHLIFTVVLIRVVILLMAMVLAILAGEQVLFLAVAEVVHQFRALAHRLILNNELRHNFEQIKNFRAQQLRIQHI